MPLNLNLPEVLPLPLLHLPHLCLNFSVSTCLFSDMLFLSFGDSSPPFHTPFFKVIWDVTSVAKLSWLPITGRLPYSTWSSHSPLLKQSCKNIMIVCLFVWLPTKPVYAKERSMNFILFIYFFGYLCVLHMIFPNKKCIKAQQLNKWRNL